MSYVEGDRIITQGNGPGRLVNTKAWVFQTNRANVTHVEEGASDPPMRAVLIEVKARRASPGDRGAGRRLAPGGRGARLGEQPGRGVGGDGRDVSSDAPPRRRRRGADLRWIDDTEGGIRAGWNSSRGPDAGRRRAGVHLRDQVGRSDEEVEHRAPCVPGHLRDGRRRRGAASFRVRTSGRQRQAGVEPLRAAHHRREVRLRTRKPVREDSHEPGDLGLRRSGRCHSGHLPHGPELRSAPSESEPAQRASAVRADSQGRRLRRRSVRRLHRGAVGRGNGAVGSGRQGAERAGVPAARREVPRSHPRVSGYRAVSGEAAHAGAIRAGRDARPPRTATPP